MQVVRHISTISHQEHRALAISQRGLSSKAGTLPCIAHRRKQVCRYRTEKEHVHVDVARLDDRDLEKLIRTESDQAQGFLMSTDTVVGLGLGLAGGLATLGVNTEGVLAGLAGGAALRGLIHFLQQTVPYTYRRHNVLLPVPVELNMGDRTFAQLMAQQQRAGKLLPPDHPDSRLVHRIADRVIEVVMSNKGGGFQDHLSKFDWECVVVRDKTANAFVLPGGKIVVYTGLLDLMDRDGDLIATVLGHEVAHAVARHSAEKVTLGLVVTIVLQLVAFYISLKQSNDPQQRGAQQRGPQMKGYGGYPPSNNPYGRGYGGYPPRGYPPRGYPPYRSPIPGYGGRPSYVGLFNAAGAMEAYGPGGFPAGPGGGGPLGNPQLINLFTNIFLQLPFSRRAEAEADLIGMKLMAMAGYDISKAPETFVRLGKAERGKLKGGEVVEKLGAVQCTHPRSEKRVQLLQEELALMQKYQDKGRDKVLHKVPYWML